MRAARPNIAHASATTSTTPAPAVGQLGTTAPAEHRVVVDRRTPDRVSHGDYLLPAGSAGRLGRPRRARTSAVPHAARAVEDVPHAVPVLRTAATSKPHPVADEDVHGGVAHLGVHVDAAGAPRGARRRRGLAVRVDHRPQRLGHGPVADRDDVDGHAVAPSTAAAAPAQGAGERAVVGGARRVEPRAQVALLAAATAPRRVAASPLFSWIRARVCSTESCRWAARSARSWVRTRSARSAGRVGGQPTGRPTDRPRARARRR